MHFSYNHDKKIGFAVAPKAGCSYLKQYLHHLSYPESPLPVWTDRWEVRPPQWRAMREEASHSRQDRYLYRLWTKAIDKYERRGQAFAIGWKAQDIFSNQVTGNAVLTTALKSMAWASGKRYRTFLPWVLQQFSVHDQIFLDLEIHQNKGQPKSERYTNILFVRDPYQRLVSAFLYIYQHRHLVAWKRCWKKGLEVNHCHLSPAKLTQASLTFEQLVNEIIENQLLRVDWGHFRPQTAGLYHKGLRFERVFDIKNIDHHYLARLFGRKEADPFFTRNHKKGWRNQTAYDAKQHPEAWKLTIAELNKMKRMPPYQSFYNNELKEKVEFIYKNDFAFLRKKGLHYSLESVK